MTRQRWRDGTLRETRLVVNGLPDAGEVELPDELFIGDGEGQVQIIRAPSRYGSDKWGVSTSPDYIGSEGFDDFAEAFAHALALVREAVEGDDE